MSSTVKKKGRETFKRSQNSCENFYYIHKNLDSMTLTFTLNNIVDYCHAEINSLCELIPFL